MNANAANGKPHGRIPYGYRRIYDAERIGHQVPDPTEAPIVQRIFDQYLSGIGQRRIANALKAEGLTRHGGAEWTDIQVKRVLVNPTYVGRRVHRGQVVGTGDWPALVSVETFERVQERVRANTERKSNVTGRASLLAGLARCGKCNGRMTVQTDRKSASGRRYYICRDNHCVSRDKSKLDAYVTAVVLDRLAQDDVRDALDSEPDPAVTEARAEVERLRSERDTAMSLWKRGDLSVLDYSRMAAVLDQRIADAEASVPRLVPLSFDLPAVDAIDAWWDGLEHEQHREVIAALMTAVVVKPTGRGTRSFEPNAVTLYWR